MRWPFFLFVLGVVFSSATSRAQEAAKLPKYPLVPVASKPEFGKLRAKQIELFNATVEELGSVYGRFTEGRFAVRELLEASERVLDASQEVFETPADRINFASKHYSLAIAIEEAVSAAGRDDQDLRLAKQLRLKAEIRMLKLTESPPAVAPMAPAPVAPAPAVGPVPRPVKPALPPGELKPLEEKELGKIGARYLDIRNTGGLYDFFMSDSGKLAVSVEGTRDNARYALWDLDKGKLLRFLSAEEGKETKDYKGEEDADFGASVSFEFRMAMKFIFSPDGKYAVGLTRIRVPPPAPAAVPGGAAIKLTYETIVWDVTSGKRLRSIGTKNFHPYAFFFVDDKRLVAKAMGAGGSGIELIDVESGEAEALMDGKGFEMYGSALTKGAVAFSGVSGGPVQIDLKSKEQTQFSPAPEGVSKFAVERSWFSKDGKSLFQKKGGAIELWDVESKSYRQQHQIVEDGRSFELVGIAADENVVVRRLQNQRRLEFVSAAEGKILGGITGLKRMEMSGISKDGKRLALPTLDKKMFILDFPDGIPAGEIPITALEQKAETEAKR
jgi:hypothetical protein